MTATQPDYNRCKRFFPLDEAVGNNRVCLISGKQLVPVGVDTNQAGICGYTYCYDSTHASPAYLEELVINENSPTAFVRGWDIPNGLTMCVWLQRKSTSDGYVWYDSSGYEGLKWTNAWLIAFSSKKAQWTTGAGYSYNYHTLAASVDSTLNGWDHFTFSYNAITKAKNIWINGVNRGSATATHLSNHLQREAATRKATIGNINGGTTRGYWHQQLLIYSYPLNITEATWLYNGGTGRTTGEIQASKWSINV